MAKLTKETSEMWQQLTLPGIPNVTSSPESAHGPTHCNKQDGMNPSQYGPEAALASRSAQQGRERDSRMSATFGPCFSSSSASANLTLCLANRLQAKTALSGSTLYQLIWKERHTPSGRLIPALRAMVRHTSGKDCTGWRTPTATDGVGGRKDYIVKHARYKLSDKAMLAGWVTPCARDWKDTPPPEQSRERERESKHNRQTGLYRDPGEAETFWTGPDWLFCRDQKWRPIESGLFPLAYGTAARVGLLRGYGNAIVAPQAQAFIEAYLECRRCHKFPT